MALLFMDGFDYQGTSQQKKWDGWTLGTTITTTNPRTGPSCSGSDRLTKLLPLASGATVICGVAVYMAAASTFEMTVLSGGTDLNSYAQFSVYISTSGEIVVYRRNQSVGTWLGATLPGVVRLQQWNYLEVKGLLDQSAGTVTVKLNGQQVLALTGQDTCYLANTAWTALCLYANSNVRLDDVYMCDGTGSQNNDFLGECRVVTLLPSDGNGSNTDFTCSSSTDHGALVNETSPNDDTDYVYSATVDHVDTWNYPALGYTGTIKGVQMCLNAKKTDSGTRAIAAVTRPASTNRVHATSHYLGTVNYIYWLSLWELNPEDSAAWEVADVDGAEFGVKVTV